MATSLLSVSKQFVHSYYKILHTSPQELHRFYKESSSFTTGSESTFGSPDETVTGLEGITEKIQQLNFQNCRVTLSVVDAQSATQGSILIVVVGHLSNNNESPRKFVQTFLLAEQSSTTNKGYYVHNDIFRYLEEGQEQEHEESVESPQQEHETPAQQSLPEVTKPKESKPAVPEETPAPKTQKEAPQQPAKPTPAPVAAAPAKVQEELPKSTAPAKPTLWASIASKVQTEQPTTTPANKPAAPTQQAPQKAASAPVRKEEKPTGQGNPSLFVSNVPFSATEDQVRAIFAKFGEIKSLSVNNNKGLAFIDMANPDIALRAIDAGRNGELAMEGRTLKVEEKKSKPVGSTGGFKGDQRGPRTDKPRGDRTGDRGDRVNGKASAPRDQKRQ